MEISKTPLVASLTFRGYAFAWFYDSNLAMAVANELLAAGLLQGINTYTSSTYGGFSLDTLHEHANWTYLNVYGHGLFVSYHRSIRIAETKMISSIMNNVIKKYKSYEKGNY